MTKLGYKNQKAGDENAGERKAGNIKAGKKQTKTRLKRIQDKTKNTKLRTNPKSCREQKL